MLQKLTRIVPVAGRFAIQVFVGLPEPKVKAQPKPRPFTANQFDAWVESHRGWFADLDMGNNTDAADVVGDMADGLIKFPTDDTSKRAVAYLRKTGVQDLVGCLANYLYEVAYSK